MLHPGSLAEAGRHQLALVSCPWRGCSGCQCPMSHLESSRRHRPLPADVKRIIKRSLPSRGRPPPRRSTVHAQQCFPPGRMLSGGGFRGGDPSSDLEWTVAASTPPDLGAPAGSGPRPRPTGRLASLQALPRFSSLRIEPCALVSFSPLLHRRAEGLGQRRVAKGEVEVEAPTAAQGLLTAAPGHPATFFLHKYS